MLDKKLLIILFGSRARATAGAISDFDVAVLGDRTLTLEEKSQIKTKLAKKINALEDKIDLVDLWNASPLLQYEVAQTGKLLEGDEFDFLRFKVLAWKQYQDTAKLRRQREQALARQYDAK
jgi:predicted nucleotidyltransferase